MKGIAMNFREAPSCRLLSFSIVLLVAATWATAVGLAWAGDKFSISSAAKGTAAKEPAPPADSPNTPENSFPRIVATSPKIGQTDVPPSTAEITVTFDRDMAEGFSWTGGGPEYPLGIEGKKPFWRDKRTCVMPVKLARAKFYRVGINSTSFQNFQSVEGFPADPAAIYFTTVGASPAMLLKVKKPKIVSMSPANGAKNVDPAIRSLKITFNVPMGGGFSWTGGGPNFPTIPPGKKPSWSPDRRTCILPVELKPDWDYRLGLNSRSHKNFQSAGGIPLDPVEYTFSTKGK
jgi:hypothetical protein